MNMIDRLYHLFVADATHFNPKPLYPNSSYKIQCHYNSKPLSWLDLR